MMMFQGLTAQDVAFWHGLTIESAHFDLANLQSRLYPDLVLAVGGLTSSSDVNVKRNALSALVLVLASLKGYGRARRRKNTHFRTCTAVSSVENY
jgi:hypothetical protein